MKRIIAEKVELKRKLEPNGSRGTMIGLFQEKETKEKIELTDLQTKTRKRIETIDL